MLTYAVLVSTVMLTMGCLSNRLCGKNAGSKRVMCERIFIWDMRRQVFVSMINETIKHMTTEEYSNFKHKTIRVVAADMMPYVMYNTSTRELHGYLADIWGIVHQKFKFKYEVTPAVYDKGLEIISAGGADILLAAVVFKRDLINVYYSHPYFYSWYHLYYKSLEAKPLSLLYLKVFSYRLWASSFIVLSVLMMSVWLTSKLLSACYHAERSVSVLSCFLGILSGFINQGFDLRLRSYSGRMQVMAALLFGVMLYYALNAALVAKLAVLEAPRPFSSLPDIARGRDLSLCLRTNSFVYNNFTDDYGEILPKWRGILNNKNCLNISNSLHIPDIICKDKVIILENKVIINSLLKYVKFPCKIDTCDGKIFEIGNSFLITKALKEKRFIDNYVLHMRSMGILQRLQKKWIENDFTEEVIKRPVQVSMEHTKAAFVFYAVAIVLSVIILILEILYNEYSNSD